MTFHEIAGKIVNREIVIVKELHALTKNKWAYRPQKNSTGLIKALAKEMKKLGATVSIEKKVEAIAKTLEEFFTPLESVKTSTEQSSNTRVEAVESVEKTSNEAAVVVNPSIEPLTLPIEPTVFDYAAKMVLESFLSNASEIPFQEAMEQNGLEFRKGKTVEDASVALDRASKRKVSDDNARLVLLGIGFEKIMKPARKKQSVIA